MRRELFCRMGTSVQKHLGADSQSCGPGSCPARFGEAEEGSKGRKLAPQEEAPSEPRDPTRSRATPGPQGTGRACVGHSTRPQAIRAVEIGQCPPAKGEDGLRRWGVGGAGRIRSVSGPAGARPCPLAPSLARRRLSTLWGTPWVDLDHWGEDRMLDDSKLF